MRKASIVLFAIEAMACSPEPSRAPVAGGDGDADTDADADADGDADADRPIRSTCEPPPNAGGADVVLAAPFDALYRAYDLGPVPGVPNPLGGTAILAGDPDTMLVAGGSESQSGAIYAIGVSRDECDHIVGFEGTATVVANVPYVDANLVYASEELLLYTEWPQFHLSQLAASADAPSRRTDLRTLGMVSDTDQGPGGLGLVPPSLPAARELRLVTWPGGRWYHVDAAPDGALVSIDAITETVTLPNEPGGFAYVPAGSPGFPEQSVIVAEWRRADRALDRVAVYEVDDEGDPRVETRREFFASFPRPWGAYFEPITGDYFFLSWGTGEDHVYVVQGFLPPEELF